MDKGVSGSRSASARDHGHQPARGSFPVDTSAARPPSTWHDLLPNLRTQYVGPLRATLPTELANLKR